MEHFKFDSFGANRASEAAVVPVDVQLEQLVVLWTIVIVNYRCFTLLRLLLVGPAGSSP